MPPYWSKLSLALIAAVPVVILAIYGALSSFFTVPTEAQAVVMRFGKPIRTVEPGLHFKIPFGVDQHLLVEVRRQLKQEFGFGTAGASNPWQSSDPSEQEVEKSMVTGDLNAALVEWVVRPERERDARGGR